MPAFSRFKAKKIGVLAILAALALIAFMLENLLPSPFIPGAKAGISNVFSLLTLVIYCPFEAMIVVAVRTVLGCVIAGNPSMLLYSFTAGEISVLCAFLLFKLFFGRISIVAVSIASAAVHNTVQLLVYRLLTASSAVYVYYPYLLLLGAISGLIVGLLTFWAIKKMPAFVFKDTFK